MKRNILIIIQILSLCLPMLSPTLAVSTDLTSELLSIMPVVKSYQPLRLMGVKVNPSDPLRLQFLLSPGDENLDELELRQQTDKLVRYFLAALAVPEKDLWVNLAPHEPQRVIPSKLGQTHLGRDLLDQDYILKQLTAKLLHPRTETGKAYWQSLYAHVYQEYQSIDIPVDLMSKVWILPDVAEIFENNFATLITDSSMKVMFRDEMAWRLGQPSTSLQSQVFAKQLRPLITEHLERGEVFSPLRQMYHAIILAYWFKRNLKQSFLAQSYANHNNITGIDDVDQIQAEHQYQTYLQHFQSGLYRYIKEDYNPATQGVMTRQYLVGGTKFGTQLRLTPFEGSPLDSLGSEYITSDVALMTTLSSDLREVVQNIRHQKNQKLDSQIVDFSVWPNGVVVQDMLSLRNVKAEKLFSWFGLDIEKMIDMDPNKIIRFPYQVINSNNSTKKTVTKAFAKGRARPINLNRRGEKVIAIELSFWTNLEFDRLTESGVFERFGPLRKYFLLIPEKNHSTITYRLEEHKAPRAYKALYREMDYRDKDEHRHILFKGWQQLNKTKGDILIQDMNTKIQVDASIILSWFGIWPEEMNDINMMNQRIILPSYEKELTFKIIPNEKARVRWIQRNGRWVIELSFWREEEWQKIVENGFESKIDPAYKYLILIPQSDGQETKYDIKAFDGDLSLNNKFWSIINNKDIPQSGAEKEASLLEDKKSQPLKDFKDLQKDDELFVTILNRQNITLDAFASWFGLLSSQITFAKNKVNLPNYVVPAGKPDAGKTVAYDQVHAQWFDVDGVRKLRITFWTAEEVDLLTKNPLLKRDMHRVRNHFFLVPKKGEGLYTLEEVSRDKKFIKIWKDTIKGKAVKFDGWQTLEDGKFDIRDVPVKHGMFLENFAAWFGIHTVDIDGGGQAWLSLPTYKVPIMSGPEKKYKVEGYNKMLINWVDREDGIRALRVTPMSQNEWDILKDQPSLLKRIHLTRKHFWIIPNKDNRKYKIEAHQVNSNDSRRWTKMLRESQEILKTNKIDSLDRLLKSFLLPDQTPGGILMTDEVMTLKSSQQSVLSQPTDWTFLDYDLEMVQPQIETMQTINALQVQTEFLSIF